MIGLGNGTNGGGGNASAGEESEPEVGLLNAKLNLILMMDGIDENLEKRANQR